VIKGYETILSDLRGQEKDIIRKKRREEYEKLRPPEGKWWEGKNVDFINELRRNRIVLNALPEYFKKLEELKDENLY